jgi:hypothetical protein
MDFDRSRNSCWDICEFCNDGNGVLLPIITVLPTVIAEVALFNYNKQDNDTVCVLW